MKTIKMLTGLLACIALSSTAVAELESIQDEDLSEFTGQKGLTIDIDYGVEIGEFMYKDAGSIVMQGVRVGGKNHCDETSVGASGGGYTCDGDHVGTSFNAVDGIVTDTRDPTGVTPTDNAGGTTGRNNIRIYVDIAGDGSELSNNGTIPNPLGGAPIGIPDNFFRWAWGMFTNAGAGGALGCGNNGNCGFFANDGDLFIHASPIDASATCDGRPQCIGDFGIEMDRFALKTSDYVQGDDLNNLGGSAGATDETTIISDFRAEGYDGAFDILIENNGNGFGEYTPGGGYTETGTGDAASKIRWNHMFEITEMEYTFDIVGIRYEKMRIHNKRGDFRMFDMFTQEDYAYGAPSTSTSNGFAQSVLHIWAVKDNVIKLGSPANVNGSNNRADYVDGITIDSRFIGDMDIGHLSFGDTRDSIGELYWTDMDIETVRTISGH